MSSQLLGDPVALSVLLDAHGRNISSAGPVTSSDKGKQRSMVQGEHVATLGEHQNYQSLPQAEFRAPGATLPRWPSTSIPSSLASQHPTLSPLLCICLPPSQDHQFSLLHVMSLVPLLSILSHTSQASSTKAIMEGISAIQEDLKASHIDTNLYRDAEMHDIVEFPLRQARHPKKLRNFIPLDTASDMPMARDKAEHKYFSACIQLHTLRMLKITKYKYLNTIKCALTKVEVEAYEQNIPGCLKVTPTNFIVDCARAKDMLYNHEAFTVFAEHFLDKVHNHGWYSSQTIPEWYHNFDVIYGAFKMHFAYIKSHYNNIVVTPSKDPVKAKEDMKARLCKSSCTSRKA
ncbi:hypothetical protein EDC04DRAFT_2891817 [Pisolithus marmoratus]|nr:hypothetical protein EDC04DRAFT_2891817 [Pisolithus marmoratus]